MSAHTLLYTIIGGAALCAALLLTGCLTPQGRAVREVGNIWLSTKMQSYCAHRAPAERAIIAASVNRRLHFAGQVRIVCAHETIQ